MRKDSNGQPHSNRVGEKPQSGFHSWRQIDDAFRGAMQEAGIPYHGEIVPDGTLHRIYVDGDRRGSRNGWYLLHIDGIPSGAFGSWKQGKGSHTWSLIGKHDLSTAERAEFRRRMEAARAARDAERSRDRSRAREKAISIWQISQRVDLHPYLSAKGVGAYGIRQYKGSLVIPLRDTEGALHSLQFIDPAGRKRFLSGGAIQGHYHAIGALQGVLCVCEGYATGATVHESTGYAVAVAFNAGNLKAVALALRGKFPEAKIILCADNDTHTPGNPGLSKAKEAADAVGGYLAYPEDGDFNDMAREG